MRIPFIFLNSLLVFLTSASSCPPIFFLNASSCDLLSTIAFSYDFRMAYLTSSTMLSMYFMSSS